MKAATLVFLDFDIRFRDADEGYCYAGESNKLLRAFEREQDARSFADRLRPIVQGAAKEQVVWPIQSFNAELQKEVGFSLDQLSDAYNFTIRVETVALVESAG